MGYQISAFVARQNFFVPLRASNNRLVVATLLQGFEMVIADWHLDKVLGIQIQDDSIEDESINLSESLIQIVNQWSLNTPIAYIQADFFGGVGDQRAALWKDGQIVLKPQTNGVTTGNSYPEIPLNQMPINTVLRELGVQIGDKEDEFVAIGLMRHRNPVSWSAAFTSYSETDYYEYDY